MRRLIQCRFVRTLGLSVCLTHHAGYYFILAQYTCIHVAGAIIYFANSVVKSMFTFAGTGLKMAEKGISLQALTDRFHLSQDMLDKEVSEEHLREVSRIIDDHEIVGPELGLSQPQMFAINSDAKTQELRRMKMLEKWKHIFACEATYRKLIKVLLKCRRGDIAQNVCELLVQSKYHVARSCGHAYV